MKFQYLLKEILKNIYLKIQLLWLALKLIAVNLQLTFKFAYELKTPGEPDRLETLRIDSK